MSTKASARPEQNAPASVGESPNTSDDRRSYGEVTPARMLSFLSERVQDLDADELRFLCSATECASHMAHGLGDAVSNIGCLINADFTPGRMRAGNFENPGAVSGLLFVIADQIRVIGELAQIGADAAFKLSEQGERHV
ncbi:hypothetical protein E2553_00135 [Paraburkholderia dipogonis]|uniref:Uncharacterized protein n=1 Tax=Paraburkholderia dipogonis TaxID=1211383 RepID=A0A4Y8N2A8_9BURK|nr:hypothetical protein [Paraburkholderia dipogonis]TFE43578.1 hypothetical protein E2553_00135 [Paraburkholderia dipogonis]